MAHAEVWRYKIAMKQGTFSHIKIELGSTVGGMDHPNKQQS